LRKPTSRSPAAVVAAGAGVVPCAGQTSEPALLNEQGEPCGTPGGGR
jgi:hypothetical protein